jgi:GTP-binding protein
MAHQLKGFEPWKGEIPSKRMGALIAKETGSVIEYSLNKLQDRGKFFVEPGDEIYTGMVVGEGLRPDDIVVNLVITKKLTNMRAAGSDEKVSIAPAIKMSLEESMEYINEDEYLEITPKHLRIRKIMLNEIDRKRAAIAKANLSEEGN